MDDINILSVDFDWIMEPSIKAYNDITDGLIPLDETLASSPGITISPSYAKFKDLVIYTGNIAQTMVASNHVVFGKNHNEIITSIENIWHINRPYNIYNIDHHHDCGYTVETLEELYNQGLGCGNWVPYCKNLNEYIWINNRNSDLQIIDEVFQNFHKFTRTSDLHLIDYIPFDYMFVCLSPGWIPSKLFPLYDVLKFNIETVLRFKEGNRC